MTRHSFIWSLLAMVLAPLGLQLPRQKIKPIVLDVPNTTIIGVRAKGRRFRDLTAILEDCEFIDCEFTNCHLTWGDSPSRIIRSLFVNNDPGPVITLYPSWRGTLRDNVFRGHPGAYINGLPPQIHLS